MSIGCTLSIPSERRCGHVRRAPTNFAKAIPGNRMQPRVIVARGGFEPTTLSVESLGLRRSAPRPWKPPHGPLEGVPTLKRHLCFGKLHKACGSQSRHAGSIFAGRVEKLRNAAPMALKTLPDCPEFYNAPNEIKDSNQTTNLGVRSSNLFGRAGTQTSLSEIPFSRCVLLALSVRDTLLTDAPRDLH
jgi:hypothetical protein